MTVFLTGSTGYLGRSVSSALLARGHVVEGLCRSGSESKLNSGVIPTVGDPLRAESYAAVLRQEQTIIHLVGTPRPAPWKADSFERVDLGSVLELARAVRSRPVSRIVYVSVAQPAPAMRAYVDARRRGELALRETGIPLTILRPWYVLGPGHRWPYLLLPAYWAAEQIPSLREGALRLGLVTLRQMVNALVAAVEAGGHETRVLDVPGIRAAPIC